MKLGLHLKHCETSLLEKFCRASASTLGLSELWRKACLPIHAKWEISVTQTHFLCFISVSKYIQPVTKPLLF